jgi:hypothetical protein
MKQSKKWQEIEGIADDKMTLTVVVSLPILW